ncbi:MAG: chemotaxis protein CheB [Planctomycetaceae bacterium]
MSSRPDQTSDKSQKEHNERFNIVGIGASAGGLEALEHLFEFLPADTGMAFVVIQHLSPDFKSHMDELLSRKTSMAVRMVEHGVEVEPNNVYLIPANKEMIISGNKLLLTDRSTPRTLSHPIDQFLRSLASDQGASSVGVILSGTGSDGSRGIRDIHDAGGLVIAQSPETARFDGMPANAVATGIVDQVLNPQEIANALVNHSQQSSLPTEEVEDSFDVSPEWQQVLEQLKQTFGIDFSQYKIGTVGRRLRRRANFLRLNSADEYLRYISTDTSELSRLYHDLLIGVTQFFRDDEAFSYLQKEILPSLLQGKKPGDSLRIWVAGCATGEEAYSLAMLFDEELQKRELQLHIKIFATDVHHRSLKTAARGFYAEEAVDYLSEERKSRYFLKKNNGFQINNKIRGMIVFAPHNVMSDAPFTQIDLISCRNMLIYLQPQAQKKVFSLFHFSLNPEGVLFLGPSETPSGLDEQFNVLSKRWKIYQKEGDSVRPSKNKLGYGMSNFPTGRLSASLPVPREVVTEKSMLRIYEALLNRKMAASILISDTFEMLHVFSGAEKYLRINVGRQTNRILDMVNDTLETAINSAIQHVRSQNTKTRYTGIKSEIDGEKVLIEITAERVHLQSLPDELFLLEFHHEQENAPTDIDEVEANQNVMSRERILNLESELRYSQENLQATIEEMQASNEELQASNEELVASNEELQSTNEELQSVNEELYTINSEHQRRVEELAQANNDMDNLLATTRVGVIFLDNDLCIRRFTPEIARQLHLQRHDIGRSIEGFSHHLNHPNLIHDLQIVIEEHKEKELEITSRSGSELLLRALPYQSDTQIEGVVMTLIDITALKKAQADVEQFKFMTESAVESIALLDKEGAFHYVNPSMTKLLGYSRDELIKMNHCDIDKNSNPDDIHKLYEPKNREGTTFERTWTDTFGNEIPVEISSNYLVVDDNQYHCIIVRDISERKAFTTRLEQMGKMVESSNDAIILWDLNGCIESWNHGATLMYGYTSEEAIGQKTHDLLKTVHPINLDQFEKTILRQGEWYGSLEHTRKDGTVIVVSSRHQLLQTDNEQHQILEINRDITQEVNNKKKLEKANRAVKQASQAKSEFLTNMSHELRTPMTAMLGFADILKLESQEPDFQEKVETIKRNGEYLLALLNDILDLSKIEAGKLEVEEEQVSVLEVIEDVRSLMSVRSAEAGIPLLFEFNSDVPKFIIGDRIRIRQILVNLLSNAFKFTDEGEVKVVVELDDSKPDTPILNIDVIDSGIGIAPDDVKRLFKPFSQVTKDKTRNYAGTGLGLSISKRLAEKMNATIDVKSDLGVGSQFRLSFELRPEDLNELVQIQSLEELERAEPAELERISRN